MVDGSCSLSGTDYDFIARENPQAAHRVVVGIYEKTQMLGRQPMIGQRFELVADREVREILYGHYRIPYLVVSDDQIEILGVFHGAMDIERHLKLEE
ncbi:MAG: type II toxin-antitoxin system RelE/ParE family toxin [Planctomycetaceae bacterium]|nr:type II toxin-antitoxin system RelE/ParE family toxin [Planctomycetaceae bacterium]